MTGMRFTVERVDVTSDKSFAEMSATLDAEVPPVDGVAFARLVEMKSTPEQVEKVVERMTGSLQFVRLAKVEQGPMVSLLGRAKKMSQFLIGNPLIANRLFEVNPAIALYAPVRVALYEDYQGKAHFTYEKPSSSLAPFDHPEVRIVASLLDEKLEQLAVALTE